MAKRKFKQIEQNSENQTELIEATKDQGLVQEQTQIGLSF